MFLELLLGSGSPSSQHLQLCLLSGVLVDERDLLLTLTFGKGKVVEEAVRVGDSRRHTHPLLSTFSRLDPVSGKDFVLRV